MNLIQTLEAEQIARFNAVKTIPEFRPGDTLRIGVKVVEGERTRVQKFEGVCIARSHKGMGSNFTVRKISFGEGVERVFPLYSPNIDSIVVVRRGVVRRSKLYYLRGRTGKSARIAEARDVQARNYGVRSGDFGGYLSDGRSYLIGDQDNPPERPRETEPVAQLAFLIQQLDSLLPLARHSALKRLMGLLPISINASDEGAEEYAIQLRRLRGRLLRAIIHDIHNPNAARYAGLALAKVIRPAHYPDDLSSELVEQRALKDLESYAKLRRLDYFYSVDPHKISDRLARIEARLWNRLPFRLNGELPRLREDDSFTSDTTISIRSDYLTVIYHRPTHAEEELDGQMIGTVLEVELDKERAEGRDQFLVDIFVGDRLLEQHTFHRHQLFEP